MDNDIPHAGGGNAQIAHQYDTYNIINDDPDLADLDDIDYDSVVIQDARRVNVTEVRLEGNTLVPVTKTDSAKPSKTYVGQSCSIMTNMNEAYDNVKKWVGAQPISN